MDHIHTGPKAEAKNHQSKFLHSFQHQALALGEPDRHVTAHFRFVGVKLDALDRAVFVILDGLHLRAFRRQVDHAAPLASLVGNG